MRCLWVCMIICVCGCSKDEPTMCEFEGSLYLKSSYPIGTAIQPAPLRIDEGYRNATLMHFNSFTPENALKMGQTQSIQGQFNFSDADSIVKVAVRNDIRVHGHTLIWHNQIPGWLNSFNGSRDEWIALMRMHITTVMQHYKGQIQSWDVVNEAFEENGNLRETPWQTGIGDDYIALAFQFAAEADPDALLFYNDYNLWRKAAKCKAAIELVEELQDRNIPIHGIGFQGHIDIRGPGRNKIKHAIEPFVDLGLQIHISELDVSVNPSGKSGIDLESRYMVQADVYSMLVDEYQNTVPAAQRYGITFWGLHDGFSWIPSFFGRIDAPLLWDSDYREKPALCSFAEGLE